MELKLSNGRTTLIDDADYPAVGGYVWKRIGRYVGRHKNRKTIFLHRELLGLKPGDGLHGHHCNGNGLDNRRCNLRAMTPSVSFRHRGRFRKSKSRVKGVYSIHRKWSAYGFIESRAIPLGTFATREEAIAARKGFDEEFPSERELHPCVCVDGTSPITPPSVKESSLDHSTLAS